MARLIRASANEHSTGKTLDSILVSQVAAKKRGALTGYICHAVNALLIKAKNKKKGIVIKECKLFDVVDAPKSLGVLGASEFKAAMGSGESVTKAMKKFGIDVTDSDFAVAAALDVTVKFKNKAGNAERPVHQVKGFTTYVHSKMVKLSESGVVRIPTKDGSVLLYIPKNPKQITYEHRQSVLKSKFQRADVEVCVPHTSMKSTVDLTKYCTVTAVDTADGSGLKLDTYTLQTTFDMDAVGARIQQKAVARLTKSAPKKPKIIKFDKPFVVIVERDGVEVFAAAINKNDWVKA